MFLKNRNIISKIKRSKVTDYAALKQCFYKNITKIASKYDQEIPQSQTASIILTSFNTFTDFIISLAEGKMFSLSVMFATCMCMQ